MTATASPSQSRRQGPQRARRKGIDFAQGDVLLRKGRRLSDRDLMLAAAMNHPALPVHRRPKVAVLGTGDELVLPGTMPDPARSSIPTASPRWRWRAGEGAEVVRPRHRAATASRTSPPPSAARATGAPIFWSPSGGASVGEHDLVQKALRRRRARLCRSGASRCGPAGR